MNVKVFACAAILIAGAIIICGCTSLLPQDKVHVKNITIAEKYPKHSYTSTCGKTVCNLIEPGSIIDTDRILYEVWNPDAWAKFEINKTYQVGYTEDNFSQRIIVSMGFNGDPI